VGFSLIFVTARETRHSTEAGMSGMSEMTKPKSFEELNIVD
jgi:hypothetical protein